MRDIEILSALFPKAKKARKPRAATKAIRIGSTVEINGHVCTVVERDMAYTSAWFVQIGGVPVPHSFSRDMIKVL